MDNVASLYARRPPAKTRWCQPGGLAVRSQAIPEDGSLGQEPLRSGPSRRAGRPKPRLPASLARGCLHPKHPQAVPTNHLVATCRTASRLAAEPAQPLSETLDSPRFATEPDFRLVSDGDFAG
jgi:hypothetical protein